MRIILTGGGTGGHVTPAIAIAEELKRINHDCTVLFIGRDGGRENEAIRRAGFEYKTIAVCGLKRSLSPKNIKAVFLAANAFIKARRILKEFKPDAVVGTGGYVTWPVVRAAQVLGIPTVIHESNAVLGLVTRLLEKRCDRVLVNHGSCISRLSNKEAAVKVGNPIRADFAKITREQARKRLRASANDTVIVSFGGSGGSEKMNEVILEVMRGYSTKSRNIIHFHATGNAYYEKFSGRISTSGSRCKILPYINDMPTMLQAADIVITRCGALTLSEISAVGVAAILIPSPNVTEDHQLHNGKAIANAGGAILIEEKDLSEKTLAEALKTLERDKAVRREMSKCIEKFAIRNARELCAREIIDVMQRKRKSQKSHRSQPTG